jgi:hypothetical protein
MQLPSFLVITFLNQRRGIEKVYRFTNQSYSVRSRRIAFTKHREFGAPPPLRQICRKRQEQYFFNSPSLVLGRFVIALF